jgi:hypothetical protein
LDPRVQRPPRHFVNGGDLPNAHPYQRNRMMRVDDPGQPGFGGRPTTFNHYEFPPQGPMERHGLSPVLGTPSAANLPTNISEPPPHFFDRLQGGPYAGQGIDNGRWPSFHLGQVANDTPFPRQQPPVPWRQNGRTGLEPTLGTPSAAGLPTNVNEPVRRLRDFVNFPQGSPLRRHPSINPYTGEASDLGRMASNGRELWMQRQDLTRFGRQNPRTPPSLHRNADPYRSELPPYVSPLPDTDELIDRLHQPHQQPDPRSGLEPMLGGALGTPPTSRLEMMRHEGNRIAAQIRQAMEGGDAAAVERLREQYRANFLERQRLYDEWRELHGGDDI